MTFDPKKCKKVVASFYEMMLRLEGKRVIRDLTMADQAAISKAKLTEDDGCTEGVVYEDGSAFVVELIEGVVYSEHSQDSARVATYLLEPIVT